MIAVTGATGKLGHLVIEELGKRGVPAHEIVAVARNPAKAADLNVEVRRADYDAPETLRRALDGADKVLLISGSEVGRRIPQHRAVIDAAKNAKLLVYTSGLHAGTATFRLMEEHKATEELIRASGIPFVILRNGWYLENYTENLAPALQHGAIVGSAGNGRVAGAARRDYAAAAAVVLTTPGHENKVYELAGDDAFTMDDLAQEVSRATGRTIVYRDLPPDQYASILAGAGLPPAYAEILADSDLGVKRGELDDRSGTLRSLIGRPTTTLAEAAAAASEVRGEKHGN